MLPDRVLHPGPLIYESGALPIALRGPAHIDGITNGIVQIVLQIKSGKRDNLRIIFQISP